MRRIILMLICLTGLSVLQAQPPGFGDPAPSGGVPVDGGLGFLLAAGIGYGAKKMRDYRRGKSGVKKV